MVNQPFSIKRTFIFNMENETIDEEKRILQKPSLRLTRNTKGYTWEIKILELNTERIEELNNQMLTKFSGKED